MFIKHNSSRQWIIGRLFALLAFLALTACEPAQPPLTELEKIQQRGVLRVGTLNNQLSYYIGPNGPTGLDYELAQAFAKQLGVQLEIKVIYHSNFLFDALENDSIDIVAAGLHQSEQKMQQFNSGPAYYYASQALIYHFGEWQPKNLRHFIDQEKELVVAKGSEYEDTLEILKKKYPNLKWRVEEQLDTQGILTQLAEGNIDFTIIDSIALSHYQRLYPALTPAFEITKPQPIVWYLRQSDQDDLYAELLTFFNDMQKNDQLATIEEKYFGHIDNFNYVDVRNFIEAIDKTLPKYKLLFQKYSNEFDWRLIAAIGYQESHWNPTATSPTGVRGIMMLTNATARAMGVSNRLDPEQSIRGGIRYLNQLVARIPETVPKHERIWFALASYNLGYGHVLDARRLAEMEGKDPNSWTDVKKQLPKLTQPKYYNKTRYGYARGYEGLNYVEKIRNYYQTIVSYEKEHQHSVSNAPTNEQGFQVISAPNNDEIADSSANQESSENKDDAIKDEISEVDAEKQKNVTTTATSEPSKQTTEQNQVITEPNNDVEAISDLFSTKELADNDGESDNNMDNKSDMDNEDTDEITEKNENDTSSTS